MNVERTSRDFENQFQLTYNMAVRFFLHDELQNLKKTPLDYAAVNQIINDLGEISSDQSFYLDNLFLYDKRHQIVLGQGRGTNIKEVFTQHYHSSKYSHEFWDKEITDSKFTRAYPAAYFSKENSQSKTKVLPLIIKSKLYPDFVMVAFLDAERIFHDFHQSINNNFYILNKLGDPLYSSGSIEENQLLSFKAEDGWVKNDEKYYFYNHGNKSNFTYINIVPDIAISSQISHLNIILAIILILSLGLGIATSIFFTSRFNNPIKRIVKSMKPLNDSELPLHHINEFDLIRDNIELILKTNQEVHDDLKEKKVLLRYYAYMNLLKKVRADFQELQELEEKNQPFLIVLFKPSFKRRFKIDMNGEEDKALQYFKEYIKHVIGKEFRDSHTLQIERREILSLIYMDDNVKQLEQTLAEIKNVLERDSDFYFFTITVSSLHANSSELTVAYEQVLEFSKYRPFNENTVICFEEAPIKTSYVLPYNYEKELDLNLKEGNLNELLQLLRRIVGQMEKKNLSSISFNQFKEEIENKIKKQFHSLNLDYDQLPKSESFSLYTVDELEQFIETLLTNACTQIRKTTENKDDLIGFVKNYIENHYSNEITLDLLAEKINITGGYLSTYFKEKTGSNFLDYVNQVRINKAKELLLDTQMKINEIAGAVGYLNLNSFNRMFKKYSGVTPSQYRIKQKLSIHVKEKNEKEGYEL
ncbi:helix-turn-helix domain-containing protein (plasmid) [Bacillus sp. F19]|nr:helix-turn-helix domain-containing protein [Bacillus sp. F19]